MTALFMVMLGGRHARANTEVHDVVVAMGSSLDEITPQLKQAWFGEQKGLHIDAWAKIHGVESGGISYQILFSSEAPAMLEPKLYLINLGGYDSQDFGELHRYVLVVAQNKQAAKQRGKQYIARHWHKAHTDRVMDIDDCLPVDCVHGRYVRLVPGDFLVSQWENTYLPIG